MHFSTQAHAQTIPGHWNPWIGIYHFSRAISPCFGLLDSTFRVRHFLESFAHDFNRKRSLPISLSLSVFALHRGADGTTEVLKFVDIKS